MQVPGTEDPPGGEHLEILPLICSPGTSKVMSLTLPSGLVSTHLLLAQCLPVADPVQGQARADGGPAWWGSGEGAGQGHLCCKGTDGGEHGSQTLRGGEGGPRQQRHLWDLHVKEELWEVGKEGTNVHGLRDLEPQSAVLKLHGFPCG